MTPEYLTLSAVAARFAVSRDSVRRWVARGVKVNGRVVKLAATRPGGSWRTTEAAVAAFVAATTPAAAVPDRTPAARRKAADAAERELIAAGW